MIPGRLNSLFTYRLLSLVSLFLSLVVSACQFAGARVLPVPVPQQLRSSQFAVQVDGKPVDVARAASSYDYVSIDATGPVKIAVTANSDGFWDQGVDIQPWRLDIRPVRQGRTIQFQLKDPAKISISRPQDFLNHAIMLFVFVSRPRPEPAKGVVTQAGYHFVESGIHRESLNPKSGETWNLAPGAVILGSLNLWNVQLSLIHI